MKTGAQMLLKEYETHFHKQKKKLIHAIRLVRTVLSAVARSTNLDLICGSSKDF
jgi:hypothetical protein